MGELLGFNRVRYTDGHTRYEGENLFVGDGVFVPDPDGVSVVHFLRPGGSTWCGKHYGPNPEDVDDDEPVTYRECVSLVRAVFRWWFPRKAFPSWLEASNV